MSNRGMCAFMHARMNAVHASYSPAPFLDIEKLVSKVKDLIHDIVENLAICLNSSL